MSYSALYEQPEEYEWPDLPPIGQMKDAIVRSHVSQGMTYILPVDKASTQYRTDLRYMFQTPYRGQHRQEKALQGSSQHFSTNTPDQPYQVDHDDYRTYQLNAESDRVRARYMISAPPRGIVGKQTTPNSEELRKRSTLCVPVKVTLPPDAQRMRQEAQRIFHTIIDKPEDGVSDNPQEGSTDVAPVQAQTKPDKDNASKDKEIERYRKRASDFSSYEELKNTPHPNKPIFPEELKSRYLSEEKNQEIWAWLTRDAVINDFNYFLNICS